MVLQCINGVGSGSNPVEGRTNCLTALKSNSSTVWFNFQTYIIYIYISNNNKDYIHSHKFFLSIYVNPNEYLKYNDMLKMKTMSLQFDILSFLHSVNLSGLHSGRERNPSWFM